MDTVLLGVGPTHICENIDISKVLTCTHLCANARCRELVEGLESKLNYLLVRDDILLHFQEVEALLWKHVCKM